MLLWHEWDISGHQCALRLTIEEGVWDRWDSILPSIRGGGSWIDGGRERREDWTTLAEKKVYEFKREEDEVRNWILELNFLEPFSPHQSNITLLALPPGVPRTGKERQITYDYSSRLHQRPFFKDSIKLHQPCGPLKLLETPLNALITLLWSEIMASHPTLLLGNTQKDHGKWSVSVYFLLIPS